MDRSVPGEYRNNIFASAHHRPRFSWSLSRNRRRSSSNSTQTMPATVTVFKAESEEPDDDAQARSSASDGVNRSAVVLSLGSPEVDHGTGDTVFSLSAEREVRCVAVSHPP